VQEPTSGGVGVSVHALVGVVEFVHEHISLFPPTTHTASESATSKCNRTTMSGSEDGKKLWEAAYGGNGEEVERLLKMGVNPEDWMRPVRNMVAYGCL